MRSGLTYWIFKMKSLIAYYSKTGNTEKVARAITKGLEADLKRIEEVYDVSGYDLIGVGTPVYGFAPAKPVKKFLHENNKNILPKLPDPSL